MQIFCDFDGTVTLADSTDFILDRFADPEWEAIEEEWKRGEIGSFECMQKQVALIRATQPELDRCIDEIKIDESFLSFVAFCERNHADITIVSDGIDYLIKRILHKNGLGHLPVISNKLKIESADSYTLQSPYKLGSCHTAAGVCKCSIVKNNRTFSVYIGDGRSDFCVADKTDIVFAKKALQEYCEQISLPYIKYDDFYQIESQLSKILPAQILKTPNPNNLFY